jgi:hypothetical protein
MAFLSQDNKLQDELTIEESIFASDNESLKVIEAYEKALENPEDEEAYQKAFDGMDQHNAWDFETQFKQILFKLKFEDFKLKVKNTDWEEISQDSSYIYVGDFGNNYQGNRTDLHILRIEKKSFLLNQPIIDTISFSYSNQTDFIFKKKTPPILTAKLLSFPKTAFICLQSNGAKTKPLHMRCQKLLEAILPIKMQP